MLNNGAVIDGRYEVLKEIGRGGMSIVYLAMDNRLNKSLVIKDIRKRDNSDNELLINSLVVEANMLKKLDHGALPKIYDIIESEGDIYVVMDYIEGESLKEKLSRETRVPAKQVIEWAKQLSDVLDYLHGREPHPIIYRDMKPDNIMLTPDGKIKLIDFGTSREFKIDHSTDTTNLGTKTYAAPEQIAGKQTDARTDIYSLGVTLYHLVTGKSLSEPPFEIKPIRYWDASLPEGLEHIINLCTQIEPDNRYQSCEELSYDLENVEKLTQGYKKHLLKRFSLFLVPAILFICFTTTSVMGYNGMKTEQFEDYMRLINQASSALIDGDETETIELLERAMEVDSKRADAYINLLDLYINRDETDIGLAKVENYLNDGYGNIDSNDQVLFKVAMTYFDIKKDYNAALTYFRKIDEEEMPDARYYKSLATTMSSLNINYSEFAENLLEFEEYNDGLANDVKKVDNYNSLANIYLSYKSQIQDANTRAIALIEKANELITILDDEALQLRYALNFERKMAQAYYSRGINSKDELTARDDFDQAIVHYRNLLDADVAEEKDVMVTIGTIYGEMGDTQQAIEQYSLTMEEYPKSIEAYVKLGNLLLDIEQNKQEAQRNYQKAKQIYDQVKAVEGATEDAGFTKFTRRLEDLSII
ncbi:serine/threonine-protein kinase [Aquibacillus rhizosphaerae]|uniref:non-specific serine/threonine protein kinase n=1 Tax=Aquibacillus rhizosphaerae TaxID=3051431 RepID=A0ABT7KZI4_9BACI|nr:serine/threonine-protein kinase [Aquibacillus sp. LR5S19]MDL4838923.1 protein kinase [Aquibacillus sp. LR5S19]